MLLFEKFEKVNWTTALQNLSLFCDVCVCMIRGHHLKLKLKTEDQLNMWGTLQYSCFIRSQTCCMGGPSHQSDLHRGERKAETVETKWKKKKAYSGSKNMVCCIIWFIISIFSLHLWDSVRQMLPWFRTSSRPQSYVVLNYLENPSWILADHYKSDIQCMVEKV